MAELAINQYGEAFAPPAEAALWLVRRMHDNKHGGPMQTFGKDSKPITLALTASLADFQAALRAHNCPPGRYRLDPLDTAGRLMKGAPVAYLPYPADRQSPPPVAADAAELPRNGNHAGAGPWAGPAPVPPLAWSTGGAFPLPAPNHLTGSEYLLGEALRAQTAMLAIMAQASATASAQHASAMSALLTAAAELVRAADGAKMPTRRPPAAPPPVIVQQLAPAYPEGYADGLDDDSEGAPEPVAPPTPPVWQQKVGEVVDQLLPVAKMVISHKMADMVGGGGADAPTAPVATGMPRNAAEVAPEPEPEPEPEIDVSPAAWSHLGAVVRMLGPAWRPRVDAQLARMTADERHAFVCSLVSLPGPKACEYVVGQISVAELRQARARATPSAAAPTTAAPTTAAPTAAAPSAATAGPIMTTLPDTTDGPHAPTEAELPVLTPPSGPAVQATIRGIVNEVMAGHIAPTAATAPTATPPTAAGPGALAGLVDTLASETSVIAPYLRRIPGGGAGVEAVAASLLGAETLAQINAELDAVPVPPVMQLLTPRAAAASKATAPTAPAAPGASPLADPAVMARMLEILPHLTPAEQATVQVIATRMPAAERNKLIGPLMSASIADAVAMVRDAVAKYEAHGRPFG